MYEHYYGFKAKPFDHSTEPDAFYLGESQKLALTSVHQGLQNGGGFIVITGLSGTGKSAFVEFLKKEQINSALNIASISAENLSDMELLPAILSSFACPVNDRSLPALIAQIENFIHDEIDHGKKPLLVVDEAQSLSHRSFEVLRLLSNFRSSGKPSFQVILAGDAGLNNILLDQKNATLKNQVVSYAEITPMQLSDTKNYVMHQLKRVGWHNDPILDDDVFSDAQKETSGIPAEINQYFDRLFEREMQKKSVKINPVNEDVSEAELGHFNQKELLAALNELESASQKNFEEFKAAKSSENIVAQAQAQGNQTDNSNYLKDDLFSGFDDGISLEETKRAFEGGGGDKKSESGFNWQLVGVILGSYLLSAIIAASFYYTDVASIEVPNNGVIMADSSSPV